jgi:hypothetical protein
VTTTDTTTINPVLRKVARRKVTGKGEHFCSLSLLILPS